MAEERVVLVLDAKEKHENKKAVCVARLDELSGLILAEKHMAENALAMGADDRAKVHRAEMQRLQAEQEELELRLSGLSAMDAQINASWGRAHVKRIAEERALAVADLPGILQQMTEHLSAATANLKLFLNTSYRIKKYDAEVSYIAVDTGCKAPRLDNFAVLPVEQLYQLLADFRAAMGSTANPFEAQTRGFEEKAKAIHKEREQAAAEAANPAIKERRLKLEADRQAQQERTAQSFREGIGNMPLVVHFRS